jgi:hypothetical protein
MECLAAREGERRKETRSAAVVLSKQSHLQNGKFR